MAEGKLKTALRGYSKEDVHKYIEDMSDSAMREVQKYTGEIERYKAEIAKYRKKLKEKDSIIKQLKAGGNPNGTEQ